MRLARDEIGTDFCINQDRKGNEFYCFVQIMCNTIGSHNFVDPWCHAPNNEIGKKSVFKIFKLSRHNPMYFYTNFHHTRVCS